MQCGLCRHFPHAPLLVVIFHKAVLVALAVVRLPIEYWLVDSLDPQALQVSHQALVPGNTCKFTVQHNEPMLLKVLAHRVQGFWVDGMYFGGWAPNWHARPRTGAHHINIGCKQQRRKSTRKTTKTKTQYLLATMMTCPFLQDQHQQPLNCNNNCNPDDGDKRIANNKNISFPSPTPIREKIQICHHEHFRVFPQITGQLTAVTSTLMSIDVTREGPRLATATRQ